MHTLPHAFSDHEAEGEYGDAQLLCGRAFSFNYGKCEKLEKTIDDR